MPFGAASNVDDVVARLRPVDPVEIEAAAALAEVADRSDARPAGRPASRVGRPHRRRHRRTAKLAVAVVTSVSMTLAASGALPAAALTVTPGTVPGDTFEQDGNFAPDAGGIDWTSAAVHVTVVEDTLIEDGGKFWDSGFQGSSKEEEPSNWTCQGKEGGVTPGKDNLLRAYVSTRFKDTTAFLDLGLVKAEGEGDTHVNFEFNRLGQVVGEALNGSCPITRSVGDFLVAYDYGGTSSTQAEVRLYQWGADGHWAQVADNSFKAAAANNTVAIADDPLVAGVQPLEPRTFSEVTIQLPSGFLTCPGFAYANVRSRSAAGSPNIPSNAITSALQDKMPSTAVDVSTCGDISLRKVDDLGNPLAGAVFGLFTTSAATGTPAKTCTTAADGTCRFSEVAPGSYWVRETAAPAGYSPDPDIVAVTVTFRSSSSITVPFENPLILGNLLITKTHSLGGAVAGVRFFLLQSGVAATTRSGASAECSTGADGTCRINGLVPGVYTIREDASTVPATMTAVADQTVTIVGNQTATATFVNPVKPIAIDLTKTVNDVKSVTTHPADEVTYKLVVKNTGELPLTITSLTDAANAVPVTLPAGCTGIVGTTIAAGASASCTYKASPTVDVTNVADVVGTDVFGRTASDSDNAAVDVITPAISLTKLVNGQESVTTHEGDALTYSISFTNTGDTALKITSLTDVAGGAVVDLPTACDGLVNDTWLAPGGTRSCTYTSTSPLGGIANTATVTGVDSLGGAKGTVTANDTATVVVINPAISITKTVDGQAAVTVHQGDDLTYVLTFTNTGDTPLTITSLTDVANGTAVDLPAACDGLVNLTPLAAGASRSCTYTAKAGAGDVANTARVAGVDGLGKEVASTDTATVDVIHPAITIVKKVNGQDSVKTHAGDALTYTLLITNTGDTPLTISALTDVAGGKAVTLSADCTALVGDSLAVGASVSCEYPGVAPANDLTNTATVTGVDTLGGDKGTVRASDDAFVDVIAPAVTIVKLVNGQDAVTVHEGDVVTYSLQVTNTGDTPLTITSLTDVANGSAVSLPAGCTSILSVTLQPTESRTCTYTATATAADVHNVASVAGRDELNKSVNDDDDADVTVISPAVSIVKTVNDADAVTVHAGDSLTYKLVITNTGDTPLTITSLTDVANDKNVALPAGCTGIVGTTLAVGASTQCSYTKTATAADVTNIATVVGEDELKKSVNASDDASVDVLNPAIQIVKTVNDAPDGTTATVHAGDSLTYTLVITNIGDADLTLTALSDIANGSAVTLPAGCSGLIGDALAVGASVECTYTTVATAADVTNVATVAGVDVLEKSVDDDDDAKVDVINPAIEIIKTVNGKDSVTVHAGDSLTYELVINNIGDTPLAITSLTDVANSTAVTLPDTCTSLVGTTLQVGGSAGCRYTTTATADDVSNVASVTGVDKLEKEVGDDDTATVDVLNPAIQIVKTVNGKDSVIVHAGDSLTYKLVITNIGDARLTLTDLDDVANGAAVTLPSACASLVGDGLAPGASVECTYTTVATADDVTNVASVEGTDELDKKVTDDDDAKVDVINPAIQIVKTANPTEIQGTSGTATFTFVVTNTGDTPLLDVVVTDDILGAIGTIGRLEVGESKTLTKTAPVSNAAPRNVGTATGTDELGKTVTDDDDASITFVLGETVVRPAPPAPPATAAAPLPRTGAGLAVQVAVGLVLMIIGGMAVLPERRRNRLGNA